ncbi:MULTISPECIES: DUF3499 domain-containing protein [unclassified Allobranchiibius]|uniref:DUF3499 domain-containing protein n=1 Tax=unclassified Allobranchiibius TaxID=2649857 RepID=UPI001AA0B944|nr:MULTISPECIES: DUF3499 domain-containing protein [unclassified Allobranchiibius]MBO1765684.1 DUF3499 domain-containing protein [Allobranchiibius sp. GilTou38]UIJ36609.1 DUF3499 domain-containing protein [Allobranchiibius sp. GilTou73]
MHPSPRVMMRQCNRSACQGPAVATLTYVHADCTIVLGPLATYAEPHSYDLCAAHTTRFTAPRGWDVVRLAVDLEPPVPSGDDLAALADAVREAGRREPARPAADPSAQPGRPRLRILPSS